MFPKRHSFTHSDTHADANTPRKAKHCAMCVCLCVQWKRNEEEKIAPSVPIIPLSITYAHSRKSGLPSSAIDVVHVFLHRWAAFSLLCCKIVVCERYGHPMNEKHRNSIFTWNRFCFFTHSVSLVRTKILICRLAFVMHVPCVLLLFVSFHLTKTLPVR